MKKILAISLLFVIVFSLNVSNVGAVGLVPDACNEDVANCDLNALIGDGDSLLNRIINFLLFYVAIPIATFSIAVAGFKLIISGDNPGERESAKKILWYAIIGLFIAFAAWLIIDLILKGLVNEKVFDPPLE